MAELSQRIDALPTPLRDLWDEDTCPAGRLPWLASAFSVDEWNNGWSDEQQRAFIKSSIAVHRTKGTIGAVRDALGALNIDVQIQEWFHQSPMGEPYTFKLFMGVGQSGITEAAQVGLFEVLARTKNLRSHLSGLEITVTSNTALFMAGASGVGSIIEVSNYQWPQMAIHEDRIIL